ncbi:MAG: hypothetical protein ACTSWP_02975 [Candidatus Freyarchaeota archaeon]|nr:hypothetical protein [Candidatus Freyrarchaeum guaymaensis]
MARKWRIIVERTNVAKWYGMDCGFLRAMNEGKIPDTVAFFYIDEPGVFLQPLPRRSPT